MEAKKPPIRILHTSDVHLENLGDSACHKFVALANLAIRSRVDLFIVVGDLFDHNRVNDSLVTFVTEELRQIPAYVVILPGNHDCLMPNSPYRRLPLWKKCENVTILRDPKGETLHLPGLGVSIWGKSIDSYDGDFHPLAGIPVPENSREWHIALAHGYYVNTEHPLFPSYHITQEQILAAAGWDYIAMGHIVSFQCVCESPVKAYYSGSPSFSGTAAMVDFTEENGVQVTPCSL